MTKAALPGAGQAVSQNGVQCRRAGEAVASLSALFSMCSKKAAVIASGKTFGPVDATDPPRRTIQAGDLDIILGSPLGPLQPPNFS